MRQQFGMRVKLASRGSGRWRGSAGYRSKFGLTVDRNLGGVRVPEGRGLDDCFQMTHLPHGFAGVGHPQGEETRSRKRPAVYVELYRLGAG